MQMGLPVIFRHRVLWHVLFWLLVYTGYTISYGGYGAGNYRYEAVINALLMPIRILFTYLFIYFILPRFLMNRRYTAFIGVTALHAFLMGFFIWLTYYFIHIPDYTTHGGFPVFYFPKIFVSIISNYAIPVSAAMITLFKSWYLDQQYKMRLEKEKLASELKYLKAQIHPHFLFNTLNNLYALTLKNSKKAPDIVLKLSGLLDYMLYHTNTNQVALEKELAVIDNYIELEKIRYGDRLDLQYHIEGDISSCRIAPLTIFPFVENAFKHGASNDVSRPVIAIDIKTDGNIFSLKVENSVPQRRTEDNNHSNGLGLENIKKQLALVYPDKHKLQIDADQKFFRILLTINCQS